MSDDRVGIYVDGSADNCTKQRASFTAVKFALDTTSVEICHEAKTNNEAEYHAVLRAVTEAAEGDNPLHRATKLRIYSDSQLVIRQLRGEYQVRKPEMADLRQRVMDIINQHQLDVQFVWLSRHKNKAGIDLDYYMRNKLYLRGEQA